VKKIEQKNNYKTRVSSVQNHYFYFLGRDQSTTFFLFSPPSIMATVATTPTPHGNAKRAAVPAKPSASKPPASNKPAGPTSTSAPTNHVNGTNASPKSSASAKPTPTPSTKPPPPHPSKLL